MASASAGTASLLGINPPIAAIAQSSASAEAAHKEQPAGSSKADPNAHPPHGKFSELPLTSIKPQGWLKAFMVKAKDGLTGHMDELGGAPFNTYGWGGPTLANIPPDWWSYEQNAYWCDGMTRCGYLLGDEDLIKKAGLQTDYVLDHPDTDGYLGPQYLKKSNRWPHVVFFRALTARYSATGDKRIPAALKRHFLSSPFNYKGGRDVVALEAVLWTYERDGDPALLDLAKQIWENFSAPPKARGATDAVMVNAGGQGPAMFTDGKPSRMHGVGYNEAAKLGVLLYGHTGDPEHLRVSQEAYRKLDKFHTMVDGVNTSTEGLTPITQLSSHETCDITDYCWSVGYLLMATGDVDYSDKIERAMFNAAPGAVTEDFTGLQYFSGPNQVLATKHSNHNMYYKGDRTMAYTANHIAQCCSGNVNRMVPNFAARLWMKDSNGGLVAAMYAPSSVTHRVGKEAAEVTINEETRYPFKGEVRFRMKMAQPVKFPFTVRIPGWSKNAKITVNGQPLQQEVATGTFVTIDRTFKDGDEVLVTLPQEIKVTEWPSNTVAVERGPLVYSLKIEEQWQTREEAEQQMFDTLGVYWLDFRFPGVRTLDVVPKSPWNYALNIDAQTGPAGVQVIEGEWSDENPFSRHAPPITLVVPAKRLVGWEVDRANEVVQMGEWWHPRQTFVRKGDFTFTPDVPASGAGSKVKLGEIQEQVSLVPYGCARLRLTTFPRAKDYA
jgi:uncharacterized protein